MDLIERPSPVAGNCRRLCVLSVTLVIYAANTGKMKDATVFWHDGRYYVFCMYAKTRTGDDLKDYRNVWSAESDDGVHLRLGYWQGNDALKGKPLDWAGAPIRLRHGSIPPERTGASVTLLARPEVNFPSRT